MNYKDFLVRFIVALVMGPLLIATFYFGKIYLLIFVTLVTWFSLKEFFDMSRNKEVYGQLIIGGASALIILISIYYHSPEAIATFVLMSIIAIFFKELYQKQGSPLLNASVTLFGTLFLSFLLGSFILLRQLPLYKGIPYNWGGGWLVMILLTTWLCDTAAYVLGSMFGKHKLIKRISPNKSIEGSAAGFVFSIVGVLICHFWFVHGLELKDSIFIGAIIGSFGQYGDLFESMIKRDAGVKDSSNLIPGHGGVYDRFDSLMVSTPIIYIYLNFYAL